MMEMVAGMCYILSMGKRFFSLRVFMAIIIFTLVVIPLGAQGFFSNISWLVEGSVFFFPEDNGTESDPMPVLPSLGMGASYGVIKDSKIGFSLELTLDFYWTNYGYSYTLNRAVPQAIENRSAQVLGFPLAIQAVGIYNVSSFAAIRAYTGPMADLRIVLLASDLRSDDKDDASKQTDSVRHYFWSKGRWFLPVAGLGTDFTLNSRFKLGVDFRVWMPMYKLWSGEDLPAIEGWRFGAGFRLTML